MAYTKQTWATGDTITAAKLNHIEDGIEGAGNSGSGFDAEVLITAATRLADPVATIVSGTFEALADLIESGTPPNVLWRYCIEDETVSWTSCLSAVTYYTPEYSVPGITFKVVVLNPFDNWNVSTWFYIWDANNQVVGD